MTELDFFAVIIALGSAIALIITSAVQNARLTRSRDEWRRFALELQHSTNARQPESR